MSTPGMLINLFPRIASSIEWAVGASLFAGLAVIAAALASCWIRARRRAAVTGLGRERRLDRRAAAVLARAYQREGPGTAAFHLGAPELLRARLARGIAQRRHGERAERWAEDASHLLEQLGLREPAFAGAPRPYDALLLCDQAEPLAPGVTCWVIAADERNLTLVSRQPCPWPARHALLATPRGSEGAAFTVSLLLRPVPPRREWVVTHDLVDRITNRRSAVRVPCELRVVCLPERGDVVELRARLQREGSLGVETLRRSDAWTRRHAATVLDLSPDGALVTVDHAVALHDRMHLVLGDDTSGRVSGLPLAEVVSLRHDDTGRLLLGTRFVGMRLAERLRLVEFARGLAASARTPRG